MMMMKLIAAVTTATTTSTTTIKTTETTKATATIKATIKAAEAKVPQVPDSSPDSFTFGDCDYKCTDNGGCVSKYTGPSRPGNSKVQISFSIKKCFDTSNTKTHHN